MPSATVDHAEAVAEADDGLDDRPRLGAAVHVGNEGAIDLDLVEREAAQVAERAIAGAEIVHGDAHAELAQLVQRGERVLAVLQQDRFGDLELEPVGRQAGGGERLQHHLDQVRA